jgi:GxxExxY protein
LLRITDQLRTDIRITEKIYMSYTLNRDLLFSDITDKIIRCAFNVYNTLGAGLKEKVYQKALCIELEKMGLKYKTEVYSDIKYQGKQVGQRYLDFLIEDKVVVELKVRNNYLKVDFDQVNDYLHATNLQVGLIILFTYKGVDFRRVANNPNYKPFKSVHP